MVPGSLTCRHCGKPIAVPASTCPWCGKTIMVICAACKQYTDDQASHCQHCGEPLVPDTLEEVRLQSRLDPSLAQLVADRERAQLLPSSIVAHHILDFFYDDGQHRTVFVELFGKSSDPYTAAAAVLFAAVAHLVQGKYCLLKPMAGKKELEWVETRKWDGQVHSLEGRLADQAGLGLSLRQVLDKVVANEMEFNVEATKPPRVPTPGLDRPRVLNKSKYSAPTALVNLGRETELPDYEKGQALREIYQIVLSFASENPAIARHAAQVIRETLEWFHMVELDPTLGLTRHT